ncbi:hypothetical protein ABPG74_018990 [Tetrahymena malaccensis]
MGGFLEKQNKIALKQKYFYSIEELVSEQYHLSLDRITLLLVQQEIRDENVKSLAYALTKCINLIELRLFFMFFKEQFGDLGFQYITSALTQSEKIQSLSLHFQGFSIRNEDVLALLSAFKKLSHLHYLQLDLKVNKALITQQQKQQIKKIIMQMKRVVQIKILL